MLSLNSLCSSPDFPVENANYATESGVINIHLALIQF